MLTLAENLYDYRELMATMAWKNIALGEDNMLPAPICPLR